MGEGGRLRALSSFGKQTASRGRDDCDTRAKNKQDQSRQAAQHPRVFGSAPHSGAIDVVGQDDVRARNHIELGLGPDDTIGGRGVALPGVPGPTSIPHLVCGQGWVDGAHAG